MFSYRFVLPNKTWVLFLAFPLVIIVAYSEWLTSPNDGLRLLQHFPPPLTKNPLQICGEIPGVLSPNLTDWIVLLPMHQLMRSCGGKEKIILACPNIFWRKWRSFTGSYGDGEKTMGSLTCANREERKDHANNTYGIGILITGWLKVEFIKKMKKNANGTFCTWLCQYLVLFENC